MRQQLRDVPVHEDPGIVTVKTELMVLLVILNPGVQTPTISSEANAEQILILSRVPEQEAALGFVFQQ